MRTLAHITADALPDGEGERLDLLAVSLAGLSKDADPQTGPAGIRVR